MEAVAQPSHPDLAKAPMTSEAVRGESRGSPEAGWRGTTLWEAAKDDERRDDERRMEENIIMNVRVEP